MQWSDKAHAGFTRGMPWLPVQSSAPRYNVAKEQADGSSILQWYSGLIRLRHENASFQTGAYVPLESGNRDVFAFARTSPDGTGSLIVLNMSAQEKPVRVSGWPGAAPTLRRVLMASPPAARPKTAEFHVAGFGALIVSFGAAAG
jgi:glycosidase